ncbi:DNA mismatch repair protein MutS [Carboxydocella sp. ULO1]|nr:DNA mismatch repair protein MutS [Carboxydocella sp. ULO1]GAW27957.1 DNA mismatch repair protein MutS [Carboxydocella sp. ULO1]
MNNNLTPMMKQYLEMKDKHKDCLLFFRLGDFYELFFEDAEIAARELEITLTGRDGGLEERVPMCGVPYHSADSYIARLINKGYKVAICEQVEDPKQAKGIVRREVIRIITPGTIIDTTVLDEKSNNFIMALHYEDNLIGLAASDVSTGLFQVTQFKCDPHKQKLIDELARLNPAEILISESLANFIGNPRPNWFDNQGKRIVTEYHSWAFAWDFTNRTLTKHFHVNDLKSLGLDHWNSAAKAAAALLDYLLATQKNCLSHINKLELYNIDKIMYLDAITRRHLELTQNLRDGSREHTLLSVLDNTVTALGGRTLKQWIENPLLNLQEINNRLAAIEQMVFDSRWRLKIKQLLANVYDLERLAGKIVYKTVNPRDLVALGSTLKVLPEIKKLLEEKKAGQLRYIFDNLCLHESIAALIEAAIMPEPPISSKDGNIIKPGFNAELDKLRTAATEGKTWLARLEAEEKEKTGIKSLKIGYNKVFGYYLEVTKANLHLVPSHFIRKQTLSTGERYVTERLKELEEIILGAEEKGIELEYQIFCQIRETIAQEIPQLQKTAKLLGELDALLSLAVAAVQNNYVKPVLNLSNIIDIKKGRHPVVEKSLNGQWFIPNDTYLDNQQNRLLIITGPNMGGKSTYMRQVALIVLMAQIGSFVPAEQAEIGLVDRIFTRVGASDDLARGQSTFMVEMQEVANILHNATAKSLIIMDEIGRGTSTFDGLSIAWAVAEYLNDPQKIGAKTLFATHYHELTKLAERHPEIKNYCVAVKEEGEDIVFLRQIVPGSSDRSYGIHVAKLAGLPAETILRAKEILEQLENERKDISIRQEIPYSTPVQQLTLFNDSNPILDELLNLNLITTTPLDALNILFNLQKKAQEYLKR